VLHFETIWLSQTPKVPGSKGWDAASVRILSVAVLLHGESGLRVLAMNTHLDDQGVVSRREAARMIVQIAKQKRTEWDVEFSFLAGDLNSEVNGDAFRILNEDGSGLIEMTTLIQKKDGIRRYGNDMTFTGFADEGDGNGMTRIDFIHLGIDVEKDCGETVQLIPKTKVGVEGYGVEGYGVLPNKFDDGVYMSDHRAVVGDVVINKLLS